MTCYAYQAGPDMVCGRCDIRWRLSDPMDRPRCRNIPPMAVELACLFCREGWHRTETPHGPIHHVPVELDSQAHGPFKCEAVEIDPIRGGRLT